MCGEAMVGGLKKQEKARCRRREHGDDRHRQGREEEEAVAAG
tara:strand:- start:2884 stop:3009 length:126 start_codon:yes stop_codon:yes gene_type:complete